MLHLVISDRMDDEDPSDITTLQRRRALPFPSRELMQSGFKFVPCGWGQPPLQGARVESHTHPSSDPKTPNRVLKYAYSMHAASFNLWEKFPSSSVVVHNLIAILVESAARGPFTEVVVGYRSCRPSDHTNPPQGGKQPWPRLELGGKNQSESASRFFWADAMIRFVWSHCGKLDELSCIGCGKQDMGNFH